MWDVPKGFPHIFAFLLCAHGVCPRVMYPLLPTILHNPVSCGKATARRTQFGRSTSGRLQPEGRKNADGLLGDAHDAAYGLIVHTHFIEK